MEEGERVLTGFYEELGPLLCMGGWSLASLVGNCEVLLFLFFKNKNENENSVFGFSFEIQIRVW